MSWPNCGWATASWCCWGRYRRAGLHQYRVEPRLWSTELRILATGAYGSNDGGAGKSVNVEYVSANPTGPLHAAHARGAVLGDALAGLLEFSGWNVTREYYVNDAGGQVDILAQSVYLRYREALGETIDEIPSGLYPGAYLQDVGAALAARMVTAIWRRIRSNGWPRCGNLRSTQ